MRLMKKTLIASAVAGTLMASSAMAGVSMNVGATSNYIWRGFTQTSEGPAVSGGLDYAHDSGFYAGTWVSNIDWTGVPGYEIDGYLGFAGEFGENWAYDVGYIYYAYPVDSDTTEADFGEVYGSIGFMGINLTQTIQVNQKAGGDNKNKAYSTAVDYTFEYAGDMSTTLLVGHYYGDLIKEGYGDTYTWGYADVTKSTDYGDVSLALWLNNADKDFNGEAIQDPRVTISWGKEF